MASSTQQAATVYKAYLHIADTADSKAYYTETIIDNEPVYINQIWSYSNLIPTTGANFTTAKALPNLGIYNDPGTGVPILQKYNQLSTTAISGGQGFSSTTLVNAIPGNFEPTFGYQPILYANNSGVPGSAIPFGSGGWNVEAGSGVIRFYAASSTVTSLVGSGPPFISFWKYIGSTGGSSSNGFITPPTGNAFAPSSAGNSSLTGNYNTGVGVLTLPNVTSGSFNIGYGYKALTSLTSGNNNIATGYLALTSLTSGTDNIAIGSSALTALQTASSNIAIGSSSQLSNISGFYNISFGTQTLMSNVSSNNNIALGYISLKNTNAGDNIGIGFQSLTSNTTGIQNVAIGTNSQFSSITASQNTAVGYLTLSANITSSGNVAFGTNALATAITSGNTAIGAGSFSTLTTGKQNTALGANTGSTTITGSGNVLLGYNAITSTSSTNNQLVAANSSTQSLIIGDFANSNIVIGATNITGPSITNGKQMLVFTTSTSAPTSPIVGGVGLYTDGTNLIYMNSTGTPNIISSANTGFATPPTGNAFGPGNSAGNSTTTGIDNTGIGINSLIAIGTGAKNTAVGFSSLQSLISGIQNTAIGSSALSALIFGGNNTALGYNALISTTNNQNTAVGAFAGASNTNGTLTALGYSAATANTTGGANVAVGSLALSSNQYGSFNVAIGDMSLGNSVSTGSNTAVGYLSLGNCISGGQNTAFGFQTLVNNVLGINNTAIGYMAASLSTGSNNIAIGPMSTISPSLVNNSLVIAAGSTQSLLIGDFINNNIYLGNSNTSGPIINGGGTNTVTLTPTTAQPSTVIGGIGLFTDGTNVKYANSTGVFTLSTGGSTTGFATPPTNNVYGPEGLAGPNPSNNSGSRNTAIGNSAFISAATASDNIAFGYQSLMSVTSGNQNTAIGSKSGNTITTGIGNVLLGYSAQVTTSGTQNNQLVVANGTSTIISGDFTQSTGIGSVGNNVGVGGFDVSAGNVSGFTGDHMLMIHNANNTTPSWSTGKSGVGIFTDGTNLYWLDSSSTIHTVGGGGGGGTPGGPSTSIQFNNSGMFGGSANLEWDGTNVNIAAGGSVTIGSVTAIKLLTSSIIAGSNNTVSIPSSTFYGIGAGLNAGVASLQNTLIGNNSGTAITTGKNTTAIGASALLANQTGVGNTAIGYDSLPSLVSGNDNTALGQATATLLTNGANNIIIGQLSGQNLTSGSGNILLGQGLMSAATLNNKFILGNQGTSLLVGDIANSNLAISTSSSYNFGTGAQSVLGLGIATAPSTAPTGIDVYTTDGIHLGFTDNTAAAHTLLTTDAAPGSNTQVIYNNAGSFAASSNFTFTSSTGVIDLSGSAPQYQSGGTNALTINSLNQGTFIGALAGASATGSTGTQSTFVGYNSGNASTGTSTDNTAVGWGSYTSNPLGASNTILGAGAASTLTAGSGNVIIGAAASPPSATTNNNLIISNTNTTTNQLIIGNFSTGNVAVGGSINGTVNIVSLTGSIGQQLLGLTTSNSLPTGATMPTGGVALYTDGTNVFYINTAGTITELTAGASSLTTPATRNIYGPSSATLQDGTDNTAIGHQSLTNVTVTGSSNTAFGSRALRISTSGSSNTAIGALALTALTTSNNNTAIGASAGVTQTISNNNIFLGAGADDTTSTTAGNAIVVNADAVVFMDYYNVGNRLLQKRAVTLTNNTATTIVSFAVPTTLTAVQATLNIAVMASNATDYNATYDMVNIVIINKGGTYTTTQTTVSSTAAATTGGNMSTAYSFNVVSTNVNIQLNANSTLGSLTSQNAKIMISNLSYENIVMN